MVLESWIIDLIKQKEDAERQREQQRPALEMPRSQPVEREQPPQTGGTVIVIEL